MSNEGRQNSFHPGNLGVAILSSIIESSRRTKELQFDEILACVRSQASQNVLRQRFSQHLNDLDVVRRDNVGAVKKSRVIILATDPADIPAVLTEPGMRDALANKLLISIAAGWTRQKLEQTLYGSETTTGNSTGRAWVVRTLPNIAAQVSQSLTAIEISEPALPENYLKLTTAIFEQIGKTVHIPPRLINAATAVGGSTPAFFAVICEAMIDAAVAVGVPRDMAHTMIFQSMQGTATMLQSGMHPALLKDQGTSPEGCTIGGVMSLEEGGVRGQVGRAVRESVTLARLMEVQDHVNDTRH